MRLRSAGRALGAVVAIGLTAPLLGAGLVLAADAYSPGADGAGDPYVPREGNGGYQVLRYDLDVRYDPGTRQLEGTATITARATQGLTSFNLDLYGLDVTGASVDGRAASVSQSGAHELTVSPAGWIDDGARFTTVVDYRGEPTLYRDPSLGSSGWFTTEDGAIVVGEPEAGMFWFPVNEHPSDKARLCVDATVPRGLQAVANGLPTGPPRSRGGWTTWSWCAEEPMASYLATLAIGTWRFDRSRSPSGVPVLTYVDRGLPRRVDRTLARTGRIVSFFERKFGPYPFDSAGGIADDHRSFYALENQTRPTYDRSTARWAGLESVVAHEIAHQWYGNSVALERWRHIWLNEGLATYGEWMWVAHAGGPSVAQQFADHYSRPRESPFWGLQLTDPGYASLFDAPVYHRGAMTLHALRLTVGGESFRRILRTWARVHEGGNVRTSDFTRLSERIAGRQLDRLFREWLVDTDKPPDPR